MSADRYLILVIEQTLRGKRINTVSSEPSFGIFFSTFVFGHPSLGQLSLPTSSSSVKDFARINHAPILSSGEFSCCQIK